MITGLAERSIGLVEGNVVEPEIVDRSRKHRDLDLVHPRLIEGVREAPAFGREGRKRDVVPPPSSVGEDLEGVVVVTASAVEGGVEGVAKLGRLVPTLGQQRAVVDR